MRKKLDDKGLIYVGYGLCFSITMGKLEVIIISACQIVWRIWDVKWVIFKKNYIYLLLSKICNILTKNHKVW